MDWLSAGTVCLGSIGFCLIIQRALTGTQEETINPPEYTYVQQEKSNIQRQLVLPEVPRVIQNRKSSQQSQLQRRQDPPDYHAQY